MAEKQGCRTCDDVRYDDEGIPYCKHTKNYVGLEFNPLKLRRTPREDCPKKGEIKNETKDIHG